VVFDVINQSWIPRLFRQLDGLKNVYQNVCHHEYLSRINSNEYSDGIKRQQAKRSMLLN